MNKEASRLVEEALSRSISARSKEVGKEISDHLPPLIRVFLAIVWPVIAFVLLVGFIFYPGWQIARLLVLMVAVLRILRREVPAKLTSEIDEIVDLIEYRANRNKR